MAFTSIEKTRLRARMSAALEQRDTVQLTEAIAIANCGCPITDVPVDGMGVSVLLRGIGWNRDYDIPAAAPIAYRRNDA